MIICRSCHILYTKQLADETGQLVRMACLTICRQNMFENCTCKKSTANGFTVCKCLTFCLQEIHKKVMSLQFSECHTKIRHVDAHATLGDGVVVQVMGELSNSGRPMRRFMQTFVLAPEVWAPPSHSCTACKREEHQCSHPEFLCCFLGSSYNHSPVLVFMHGSYTT